MRILCAAAIAVVIATPALAWDNQHPTTKQLNQASAAALATSSSSATATVTGRGGDYRGGPVVALGGLSSGVCSGVSGGLTVAVPMVGVGIQGGGIDDDCTYRNNALVAEQLGDHAAALRMLRHLKGYQE